MIIKAGRLISRQIPALIVLSLLLVAPFLGTGSVAAMPMRSAAHDTSSGCATLCLKSSTPTAQQPAAILENDDDDRLPTPLPPDTAPYFAQFLARHLYKVLKPTHLYRLASFVPPDLVTLYENFRI